MEEDIEGPDGDPMENFGITAPWGAASRSRRHREAQEYMEGVRRGVLGRAYLEEPRRSREAIDEEIDVAAVGTHGGRQWEPWWTSRPADMVFKAAEAAVRDVKAIRHPMYDGNPLNLDRFFEKPDNWGITVTEDMDPAAAPGATSWHPRRRRSRPSRRPRSGSASKSQRMPPRLPQRGGGPSGCSMMAG